jgi:hypothetical protein
VNIQSGETGLIAIMSSNQRHSRLQLCYQLTITQQSFQSRCVILEKSWRAGENDG